MDTKENYGGLDLFRLIAAILVIAIHTSPLTSFSSNADFFLTRILARTAVPFFFMMTGQFVVSRFLNSTVGRDDRLKKYLKKVSILYAIAILIYIPIGIYAGNYHNLSAYGFFRMLVFDGTFYHLWYFPASIIGVTFIYLMSRIMSLKSMFILSGLLYLLGLLGDSYYGLIQNIPVIGNVYSYGFLVFSYTRNGLFFAPIFLLLGVWVGNQKGHVRKCFSYTGLGVSFLLMITEAFALHYLDLQRHDSMYLTLIPVMILLYQILMNFNSKPFSKARFVTTWIYILHPGIIIVIRGVSKLFGITRLLVDNSLIHYLAVVLLSFVSAFLLLLIRSNPWKREFKGGRAWVELNRVALSQNVQFLYSRLPEGCMLMAAVKAEAYGHGAVRISKELNHLGVHAFCVACIAEAITLRKHGIAGEILVLGYTSPKEFSLLYRYHLTQTVVDYSYALELNQYGKKLHVHIGVDTGMHRLGERCENMEKLCSIYEMKNLVIDGIFTHLSAANSLLPEDKAFTKNQVSLFYQLIDEWKRRGYPCPKLHLQSSYGVLNYPELAEDYARVGIALYGVLSNQEDTKVWKDCLYPVLTLKARVAIVKDLYRGESVGYGMGYIAKRSMRIATIAIGYADGLPRSLSNGKGSILIKGHRAPIIGRICMDQTIVDVSEIPNVKTGDIAVLIGKSGNEEISVTDLAKQADTITNEVLSRLSNRLEQIMVNGEKL